MSLPNCLPDLLASGAIRKGDKAAAERAWRSHYGRLASSMSPEAAGAEASRLALAELRYQADLKGRRLMLTIRRQQALDKAIDRFTDGGGNPYRALIKTLGGVEIAQQRIEFQAHVRMREFIERHRRNFTGGSRDKTGMVDVVRELHGQKTGNDAAALFADTIRGEFERLVKRFNRAGGDVALRADFGTPHAHDSLRVRKAGFEQWRADLLENRWLDLERMTDPFSGQTFTPDRLEEFLFESWKQIATGGLTPEGSGSATAMLANRRRDHRLFVFRDGDAWLAYNERYGTGNPFDQIMGHVSGLARDIAFMEALGPNPAASWKRAMARAAARDTEGSSAHSGAVAGTSFAAHHADKMWRYMNGDFSIPVLPDGRISGPIARRALATVHGARDIITAAFLGSAQLTAVSDINTQAFARAMNDLPMLRAASGYLSQLNPLSHADRREAIRLGLGMRDATRAMLGIARFMGQTHGPGWTQVVADDVLRLSGINKFTEAGQRMFGKDYLMRLAEERELGWEQLGERRRAAFERHGIGEADWDAMRSAPTYEGEGGVRYMDWQAVAAVDQGAADRMMDMILAETRLAVIEAGAETAALTRLGRPGTLAGELGANVFQFKSFPIALFMDQSRRVAEISRRFGPGKAGLYTASFLIGMSLFGAIALQLREIAKGRDMRPMNEEFWADATLQGGGAGIFGDVIGSFTNDRLNGVYQLAGGPMIGLGEDLKNLGGSFFQSEEQAERGEPANPGRSASRFLRRYTPGTSLWWARAALDRMIFDQIAAEIDPEYWESWNRMEQAAERQGQGYWWRPGEMAPERMPTMGETPE